MPLKTLARFKCVSKQWQYLISNTIYTTNPKLLIYASLEDGSVSLHSLDLQETCIESKVLRGNLLQGEKIIVCSSCNRLLLFQIDNRDDLFTWYPLTKFFRKVQTYDGLSTWECDLSFYAEISYDSMTDA